MPLPAAIRPSPIPPLRLSIHPHPLDPLRTHPAFRRFGENPFNHGYSIVDPNTPDRVARDAVRIRERGVIQLCTLADAWAPEAKQSNIGRRSVEAILSQRGWSVRILTKNAAVVEDFDLIEQHRDRVLVGLSLTATPENSAVNKVLEPNASDVRAGTTGPGVAERPGEAPA